jgi:hypothetical protein
MLIGGDGKSTYYVAFIGALWWDNAMPRSAWDKPKILKALRRLSKQKQDLSYNRMTQRHQALVSAAAYHFGSYRAAVEHAEIDYRTVLRRPRWTKLMIIKLIKAARRAGEDLHWSAVTQRRDDLGKAAFAALQSRLFGRWDKALQAAGLDVDDVAIYRRWDSHTILFELRCLARDGEAVNSGAIQREDPGLHAAAVRQFGGYDQALRAAKLDPLVYRRRRRWTPQQVVTELKMLYRGKSSKFSATALRKQHSSLYGAALRHFGSLSAACGAAGLRMKTKKRPGKRIP